MPHSVAEIDSFFIKFKTLTLAGTNASLTIKAEAGKATVTLSAEVDVTSFQPSFHHVRGGPARQRRRERRAAARASVEEAGTKEAEVCEEPIDVDKTDAKSIPQNQNQGAVKHPNCVNVAGKADTVEVDVISVERTENVALKAMESVHSKSRPSQQQTANDYFPCRKCEFVGKTFADLKTHMNVIHQEKISLMKSFTRANLAK